MPTLSATKSQRYPGAICKALWHFSVITDWLERWSFQMEHDCILLRKLGLQFMFCARLIYTLSPHILFSSSGSLQLNMFPPRVSLTNLSIEGVNDGEGHSLIFNQTLIYQFKHSMMTWLLCTHPAVTRILPEVTQHVGVRDSIWQWAAKTKSRHVFNKSWQSPKTTVCPGCLYLNVWCL